MSYHLKDGWYFERLPEGKVHITKRETGSDESPIIAEVVVESDAWCSIIASASAMGETARKFDESRLFHNKV